MSDGWDDLIDLRQPSEFRDVPSETVGIGPPPSDWASVRKAAAALLAKLDTIVADERYKSVWTLAYIHGQKYTGPNWEPEYNALKAALAHPAPDPPSGEAALTPVQQTALKYVLAKHWWTPNGKYVCSCHLVAPGWLEHICREVGTLLAAPHPPSGEAALTLEQVRALIAKWRRRARVDCDPANGSAEVQQRGRMVAACADELEALLAALRTEKPDGR